MTIEITSNELSFVLDVVRNAVADIEYYYEPESIEVKIANSVFKKLLDAQ